MTSGYHRSPWPSWRMGILGVVALALFLFLSSVGMDVALHQSAQAEAAPELENNVVLGSWSPLGHKTEPLDDASFQQPGLNNAVYTMASYNGYLYVGGLFDDTGGGGDNWADCSDDTLFGLQCIARHSLDDTASPWQPVGAGFNHQVDDMVVMGGKLYVTGKFDDTVGGAGNRNCDDTHVGGLNCIAVLNNTSPLTWSSLGNNGLRGNGLVLGVLGDDTLLIGGGFGRAGDAGGPDDDPWGPNALPGLAAWNRTSGTWTGPGLGGFNSLISSLTTDGNQTAFMGGEYIGDISDNGITRMRGSFDDPTAWSAMADGFSYWDRFQSPATSMPGRVDAIAILNGTVYAGGYFDKNGPRTSPLKNLAKWTGSAWQTVGAGLNYDDTIGGTSVQALATDEARGLLYIGGTFTGTGDDSWIYPRPVEGIHIRDGRWLVDSPLGGRLRTITVWDSAIEEFVPFQWDTADDSNGLTHEVHDIVVDDSVVYVGGLFNTWPEGGFPQPWNLKNIGKWTWLPPSGSVSVSAAQGGSVAITGTRFIGVPSSGPAGGVKFGSTQVSFTRSSTTSITATVPCSLSPGSYTISVNGVGGWGNVGNVAVTSSSACASSSITSSSIAASPTSSLTPTSAQLRMTKEVRPNRFKALALGVPSGSVIVLVDGKPQRSTLAVTSQAMTVRTGPITMQVQTQTPRGVIQAPTNGRLNIPPAASSTRNRLTSFPNLHLSSNGNAPLSPMRVFLIPQPRVGQPAAQTLDLGYLMTDAQGRLQGAVRPQVRTAGDYIVQINGVGGDGRLRSINLPATVNR